MQGIQSLIQYQFMKVLLFLMLFKRSQLEVIYFSKDISVLGRDLTEYLIKLVEEDAKPGEEGKSFSKDN